MTKKHYEVLGITETASASEIKKAYRKLSLQWHPDKIKQTERREPNGSEKSKWDDIEKAHRVLSDPEAKAIYDRGGSDEEIAAGTEKLEKFRKDVIDLMTAHIANNNIEDENLEGFINYDTDIANKNDWQEIGIYVQNYLNWAETKNYKLLGECQTLIIVSWLGSGGKTVKYSVGISFFFVILAWLARSIWQRRREKEKFCLFLASGDNDKIWLAQKEKKNLRDYHRKWFWINLVGYVFFVPLNAAIIGFLFGLIGVMTGKLNENNILLILNAGAAIIDLIVMDDSDNTLYYINSSLN